MNDRNANLSALKEALHQALTDLYHKSRAVVTLHRFYGEATGAVFAVKVLITWTPTEYQFSVGMRDRPNNPFSLFQNRVSEDEYLEAILRRVEEIVALN